MTVRNANRFCKSCPKDFHGALVRNASVVIPNWLAPWGRRVTCSVRTNSGPGLGRRQQVRVHSRLDVRGLAFNASTTSESDGMEDVLDGGLRQSLLIPLVSRKPWPGAGRIPCVGRAGGCPSSTRSAGPGAQRCREHWPRSTESSGGSRQAQGHPGSLRSG